MYSLHAIKTLQSLQWPNIQWPMILKPLEIYVYKFYKIYSVQWHQNFDILRWLHLMWNVPSKTRYWGRRLCSTINWPSLFAFCSFLFFLFLGCFFKAICWKHGWKHCWYFIVDSLLYKWIFSFFRSMATSMHGSKEHLKFSLEWVWHWVVYEHVETICLVAILQLSLSSTF